MTLLDWATAFFSKGLGKFAISVYVEKYLNIAILYRIFPLVSEKISQIQSDPCPLVYSDFTNGLGKYAISVNVEKYLKIAIWFGIFPRFQRCYRKFNQTLLHWATEFFCKTVWRIFEEQIVPGFFMVILYITKHICLYWTRQSASH